MIHLSSIKAVANKEYSFRFLDLSFPIKTNRASTLIYFKKLYDDFFGQDAGEKEHCDPYYVIDERALFEKPFIWADNKIYPCSKDHMLPGYAHSVIMNSIKTKIESYLLFHAAAVSWQNQGIVITGPAGQGKSTLTLALIRRGFEFLSDEIACIKRKNYLIYPFNRALGLRRNALPLFRKIADSDPDCLPMISDDRKYIIQLSDIPHIKMSGPCLPRYLICLSSASNGVCNQNKKKVKTAKKGWKLLYLAVDRFDDTMMKALMDFSQVKEVKKIEAEPCPVIKLTVKVGSFLLPKIEDLCRQYQIALFDISKEEKKALDYSQKPHIEKISKSTALMELLRSFQGGQRSIILQKAEGNIASLLFEMGHILKNIECYRMIPGRLDEMVGLIRDL